MIAEQRTRCKHAAAHHAALLAWRNPPRPRDLPSLLPSIHPARS